MRTVSILALALCLCGTAVRATLGGTANPQLQAAVENALGSVMGGVQQSLGAAGTLHSAMGSFRDVMLQNYATLSKMLEQQVKTYENQFCTPGSFTPGSKVPATFTGQSFSLTFDSGSCFYNETQYFVDGVKELNCTEPSITYVSSPANFTSAYHSAASFVSKECQISKTFGEPIEKVLYVFDGQYSDGEVVDTRSLAVKIMAEMQSLISGLGSGSANVGSMASAFAQAASMGVRN